MINTTSTVTTTSAAGSSGTGSEFTAATKKTMGKEDFLQLLITQLRNQDPLAPEDPKDFVAQLAQFTSLEQQINTNTNLESLGAALKTIKNANEMSQGVSMLGKSVKGVGNGITVASGQASSTSYNLPLAAKSVKITIMNGSGQTVRTLNLGQQAAGDQSVVWDAKDDRGQKVADGNYFYQVSALDSKGGAIGATNYFTGKVDEVFMDKSGVWVKVSGRQMLMENIVSITP